MKFLITVTFATIMAMQNNVIAAPVYSSTLQSPKVNINVFCGWDVNRDGKVDFSISAKLPQQKNPHPNWSNRCHQARLIGDDTYNNMNDLYFPDPNNTTVFHNVTHYYDDDGNGNADDANINLKLPAQNDPETAFTPMQTWNVRRALDDQFTKPYPIP